jgi:acetyl-CoA carboxylase biotin carboxyl carrier protein
MDLDRLRQILGLVREHELSELEIEQEGWRLKVRKDFAASSPAAAAPGSIATSPATSTGVGSGAETAASGRIVTPPAGAEELELAVVKSPIVGTFYRSAEPGSAPFVEIGVAVKKGQVLCIIEAMKLMNEIDSEYEGEVTAIYVENGQAVQYGERLFAIKTK